MSFLNNLRSVPLPPVKNMLNVALQTARQTIPAKQKQNGYEEQAGDNFGDAAGGAGGMRSPPQVPPRPQNVHFAETDAAGDTGGTTEMNPLNPFTNPKAYYQEEGTDQPGTNQYQETGFNQGDFENGYQAGGYPPRQGSVQSFGSDSTFAGGCEGEAPGGAKINEYQAAWNVTNAIQESPGDNRFDVNSTDTQTVSKERYAVF